MKTKASSVPSSRETTPIMLSLPIYEWKLFIEIFDMVEKNWMFYVIAAIIGLWLAISSAIVVRLCIRIALLAFFFYFLFRHSFAGPYYLTEASGLALLTMAGVYFAWNTTIFDFTVCVCSAAVLAGLFHVRF